MVTKETKTSVKEKYFEAVGRRKTSVARVRLFVKEKGKISVNERVFEEYFPTKELQNVILDAFVKVGLSGKFAATVKLNGGGIHSQAEALRHAISRALLKFDVQNRPTLKKAGLLTRDPRAKERRKFGLKKARKAPQWSKR